MSIDAKYTAPLTTNDVAILTPASALPAGKTCLFAVESNGVTITWPFTPLRTDTANNNGIGNFRGSDFTVAQYVTGGSEPASYTINVPGLGTKVKAYLVVLGGRSGSVVAAVISNNSGTGNSPITNTATGIISSAGDDLVEFLLGSSNASPVSESLTTVPSGFTAGTAVVDTTSAFDYGFLDVATSPNVVGGSAVNLVTVSTLGASGADMCSMVIRAGVAGTTLTVDSGSITIAPQDIAMTAGASVTLPVTEATISLSGSVVNFNFDTGWTEALLTLTGQDVGLQAGVAVVLPVTEATLTITGSDISLLADFDYTLVVTEASLTITGQDVSLNAATSLLLAVTSASLSLTGQDITLFTPFATGGSSKGRGTRRRAVIKLIGR